MDPKYRKFRSWLPPLKIGPRLFMTLGVVAVYSVVVGSLEDWMSLPEFRWGTELTVLNGLVLGLLLGFRNNAAYDRWWEGRKQWGQLVNESRNIALKARAHLSLDGQEVAELKRLLNGFAEALRRHLHDGVKLREVPGFEGDTNDSPHVPGYIAGLVFERLAAWKRMGRIDGWVLQMFDTHVKALMDITGCCERIKSTPLAFSYRALLRHGTMVYILLSPIISAREVGWEGLPGFLLVAYFLIGVEMVADDVEDPFGTDGDDLAVERYCATIRWSLDSIFSPGARDHSPMS